MPRTTLRWLSALFAIGLVASPAHALAVRLPSDSIRDAQLSAGTYATALAPDMAAPAGILVTTDGRVLWSRQPDAERPMASTTKLMTALLALQHGGLDDTVTVSAEAAGVKDASGLDPGQQLTFRKLLELMLVYSANDAAYAVGEHVSGSMTAFVRAMNAEAAHRGLAHTHYVNPHGLDEAGHYSSPRDLATLAMVDMGYPEFRRIVLMPQVRVRGRRGPAETFASTDELLGKYVGITGVKTGYTAKAGYCFVASAQRSGVTLFGAVLGTPTDVARFAQTRILLDWGFRHVQLRTMAATDQTAGVVPVVGYPGLSVGAVIPGGTAVAVCDLDPAVTRRISLHPAVALPVFEGEPLGEVTWLQGSGVVTRTPVVAADAVASALETIGAVPVSDFVDRTVTVRAGPTGTVAVFDPSRPVRRQVSMMSSVAAPVAKGRRLGRITYSQDGTVVAHVPVLAAGTVAAPAWWERFGIWCTRTWRRAFGGPLMAAPERAGS